MHKTFSYGHCSLELAHFGLHCAAALTLCRFGASAPARMKAAATYKLGKETQRSAPAKVNGVTSKGVKSRIVLTTTSKSIVGKGILNLTGWHSSLGQTSGETTRFALRLPRLKAHQLHGERARWQKERGEAPGS
eukprot:6165561-Amphidinium_carterae.1